MHRAKKAETRRTWNFFPEVTDTVFRLSERFIDKPVITSKSDIERLASPMRRMTTNCLKMIKTRKEMFIKDEPELNKITSTSNALMIHVSRASYMAGHVWSRDFI